MKLLTFVPKLAVHNMESTDEVPSYINKLVNILNISLLKNVFNVVSTLNSTFSSAKTVDITILDGDATNYHHLTFVDGILTTYIKDTNA
jgi:hypothetical protein